MKKMCAQGSKILITPRRLRVPDAALSFEINEFRVWRSALILFRTSISRAFQ